MSELVKRLNESMSRIGNMCSEGRPPKMSIPARPEYDDDLFIIATIKSAIERIAELEASLADSNEALQVMGLKLAHAEGHSANTVGGPTPVMDAAPALSLMFTTALQIATEAHMGKVDKGGKPYILHCLRVMHRLDSDDLELCCIALLHDAIEDSNFTFADLVKRGMSNRVVRGVADMTKQKGATYDDYINNMGLDALLVKRSDLRDNSDITRLKGVEQKDVERLAKYSRAYRLVEALIANCSPEDARTAGESDS